MPYVLLILKSQRMVAWGLPEGLLDNWSWESDGNAYVEEINQ